jgi:hypothetical protein
MNTKATAVDTSLFSIRVEETTEGDIIFPVIDIYRSLGMNTPEAVPTELACGQNLKAVFAEARGKETHFMSSEDIGCMLTVDYMSEASVALFDWFMAVYVDAADQGVTLGNLQ